MISEYKLESYWHDIPAEKSEAATYADLIMWWGVGDREVRRILHELSSYDNGDDFVLIRSSKNRGFFKTNNKDLIEAYRRECLNRGKNVFAPLKKIDRILKANTRQYSLVNNLRVVREDRRLKQTDVCDQMKQIDEHFDVPMLSKMENGVCLPTPIQLAKLSEIYGCQPDELVKTDLYY